MTKPAAPFKTHAVQIGRTNRAVHSACWSDYENWHDPSADVESVLILAEEALKDGWTIQPPPTKPAPLTLAEAIDAFPVLTGHRHGTGEHEGRLFISDPAEFIATAGTHGNGAKHAAAFIASLAGYNIPKAWATLRALIDAIDNEHQAAAGRVFMAAMNGGLR